MACQVGYGAYRYEEVDHPVNVRVIGPSGQQFKHLSRAYSFVWKNEPDRAKAVRAISAQIWMLNVAHNALCEKGGEPVDVAELFLSGVSGCRKVQDWFVSGLKITTLAAGERDGSMWLKPSAYLYGKVADAVAACGKITAALTLDDEFENFGEQDPSKVNREVSRIGGKAREIKVTRRGIRLDVDNRLRMGTDPTLAPRFDDPRFYDRLRKGFARIDAPLSIRLISALAYGAGGRAMSILRLTMFDLLVRRKKLGQIPSPNKGGGPDDRKFIMIPPEDVYRAILEWVAGERAATSGYSLQRLKQMAKDPSRKHLLKEMPLFTENGRDFVKYNRLYRVFRRAAEKMNLFINDEEYHGTGRKRYVSFHYLRHEYVHRRLDSIEAFDSEDKRVRGRKAIIRYMRWKNDMMLEWYSQHHVVKLAETAAEDFNKDQDVQLEGAVHRPKGVVTDNDADDAVWEAFA